MSGEPRLPAHAVIRRIVSAYDDPIVRAYCTVRFQILRQRFLFEIGQYLPASGRVLDIGCGFGLFALYFAIRWPAVTIEAFDRNVRRIELARRAADRLGVRNVRFGEGDAATLRVDRPVAGAYMLDLIHHLPEQAVGPLLRAIASQLAPGGRLVVKDIEPSPAYKLAFTWLLDKLMDYRSPLRYWAPAEIQPLLESLGLTVHRHSMIDYLPYPHVIYIATRESASSVSPEF
jgi:SAM-dependent methyltransferase